MWPAWLPSLILCLEQPALICQGPLSPSLIQSLMGRLEALAWLTNLACSREDLVLVEWAKVVSSWTHGVKLLRARTPVLCQVLSSWIRIALSLTLHQEPLP